MRKKNVRFCLIFKILDGKKFNKNNFRDPRLKWYDPVEIRKVVEKFKVFKIRKFKGYLPMIRKEVPLNKAICIFLHFRKREKMKKKFSFEENFLNLINNKKNKFHPLTWINGKPKIGSGTYIGGFSIVNAKDFLL